MRSNDMITNQDKLGQLLKENRPLPNASYCLCMDNALDRMTTQSDAAGALRERKQSVKKKSIWKYAVSVAAVAVIGIGITIGFSLLKQQPNQAIVENTPGTTASVQQPSSGVQLTVQERIVNAQEFSTVSPSVRSSAEVKTLMQLAGVPDEEADKVQCYEDERYFYFFYDDGTAAGIMAAYLNDDTFDPDATWSRVRLSEDEAIARASAALLKYDTSYTKDTAERFAVKTLHADADDVPHYPEWSITFAEYTHSGILRNTVVVDIDMYGNVAAVFFGIRSDVTDEQLEQNVYIPEEIAVSLALEQFKKEERDVDLEHFTVTATLVENNGVKNNGTVEWVLFFEEIADENGKYLNAWRQCYWMLLDAVSGEWIITSVSR